MLPVAECNLARYLEVAILNQETRSFLPSFFGCLSRGLWHIHQQKLRHRDIKPENILVSDNKVLFADFGCAHDWSHTLHSTTVGVPPRTQQYASPEVAYSGFQNGSRINSSSDIWSLGCVFLEIANVWKKQSVAELDYLKHPGYYQNIRQVRGCLEQLRTIESRPSISGALDWIQEMLQVDSTLRPTAQRLVELTSNFCCLECRSQDNRQITENRTLEESESNDENNVERLESDRIVQFDIQERSTSPSNAKGRVANESNIITAVCKEMGKDPRSLSEEQEGFIVATYNFVLKRVVGLN
jgi:serine/threonine protein kinase